MVVLIGTCTRVATVHCELRLHGEALQRVELQIAATEETGALNVTLVCAILVEQRRTVSRVPGVWSSVDATVVQISVSDRGHLLGLVEYTAVTLVVALISIREAGTDFHDLVDLVVDVHTTCITLVLIALQQTLIVHGCH